MTRSETSLNPYASPEVAAVDTSDPREQLPPLSRDSAYWGMTLTQFLGAFNDSVFKQIVLLLCLPSLLTGGADWQPWAMAIFAIPFILFSGYAGFLADRISKRRIVIGSKMAEVVFMALGMAAFVAVAGGELAPLLAVLCLMGTQSAVFGPSKYGILPEMLRGRDLPTANGMFQMTTFIALIFGTALAGVMMDEFHGRLWINGGVCVLIAVVGTGTSFAVRRVRIAQPGLKFSPSAVAIPADTWRLIMSDRSLLAALLVYSLFWFMAGIVQPAVNVLGRTELGLSNTKTSLMVASMGFGIAAGCLLAGRMSHGRVSFKLVNRAAWGMAFCLSLETLVPKVRGIELPGGWSGDFVASCLVLGLLGVFAGMFAVPLQVYLQARPPENQKGRMIGSMNLINWIAIFLAAAFYAGSNMAIRAAGGQGSWVFAILAVLLLPVAMLYRPADQEL